jgi:hypothetical protein
MLNARRKDQRHQQSPGVEIKLGPSFGTYIFSLSRTI